MAYIGSGFQQPQIYSPSPYQGVGQANNLSFSPTAPTGMNYGSQMMGEMEVIQMLMQLLSQGASAPSANQAGGMNPVSLNAAAGKGGTALRQAPAKGAPALQNIGGKGEALKKTAGK